MASSNVRINLSTIARLANLADPQNPDEAATKAYVDARGGGDSDGGYNDSDVDLLLSSDRTSRPNFSTIHPSWFNFAAASSTPRAADSDGGVGTSLNYARADHQHPFKVVTLAPSGTGNLTYSDVTGVLTYTPPVAGTGGGLDSDAIVFSILRSKDPKYNTVFISDSWLAPDIVRDNELTTETTNRQNADSGLGARIDDDSDRLTGVDSDINARLDSELRARRLVDSELGRRLDSELVARRLADSDLKRRADSELVARRLADSDLKRRADSELVARRLADSDLKRRADSELVARRAADSDFTYARNLNQPAWQAYIRANQNTTGGSGVDSDLRNRPSTTVTGPALTNWRIFIQNNQAQQLQSDWAVLNPDSDSKPYIRNVPDQIRTRAKLDSEIKAVADSEIRRITVTPSWSTATRTLKITSRLAGVGFDSESVAINVLDSDNLTQYRVDLPPIFAATSTNGIIRQTTAGAADLATSSIVPGFGVGSVFVTKSVDSENIQMYTVTTSQVVSPTITRINFTPNPVASDPSATTLYTLQRDQLILPKVVVPTTYTYDNSTSTITLPQILSVAQVQEIVDSEVLSSNSALRRGLDSDYDVRLATYNTTRLSALPGIPFISQYNTGNNANLGRISLISNPPSLNFTAALAAAGVVPGSSITIAGSVDSDNGTYPITSVGYDGVNTYIMLSGYTKVSLVGGLASALYASGGTNWQFNKLVPGANVSFDIGRDAQGFNTAIINATGTSGGIDSDTARTLADSEIAKIEQNLSYSNNVLTSTLSLNGVKFDSDHVVIMSGGGAGGLDSDAVRTLSKDVTDSEIVNGLRHDLSYNTSTAVLSLATTLNGQAVHTDTAYLGGTFVGATDTFIIIDSDQGGVPVAYAITSTGSAFNPAVTAVTTSSGGYGAITFSAQFTPALADNTPILVSWPGGAGVSAPWYAVGIYKSAGNGSIPSARFSRTGITDGNYVGYTVQPLAAVTATTAAGVDSEYVLARVDSEAATRANTDAALINYVTGAIDTTVADFVNIYNKVGTPGVNTLAANPVTYNGSVAFPIYSIGGSTVTQAITDTVSSLAGINTFTALCSLSGAFPPVFTTQTLTVTSAQVVITGGETHACLVTNVPTAANLFNNTAPSAMAAEATATVRVDNFAGGNNILVALTTSSGRTTATLTADTSAVGIQTVTGQTSGATQGGQTIATITTNVVGSNAAITVGMDSDRLNQRIASRFSTDASQLANALAYSNGTLSLTTTANGVKVDSDAVALGTVINNKNAYRLADSTVGTTGSAVTWDSDGNNNGTFVARPKVGIHTPTRDSEWVPPRTTTTGATPRGYVSFFAGSGANNLLALSAGTVPVVGSAYGLDYTGCFVAGDYVRFSVGAQGVVAGQAYKILETYTAGTWSLDPNNNPVYFLRLEGLSLTTFTPPGAYNPCIIERLVGGPEKWSAARNLRSGYNIDLAADSENGDVFVTYAPRQWTDSDISATTINFRIGDTFLGTPNPSPTPALKPGGALTVISGTQNINTQDTGGTNYTAVAGIYRMLGAVNASGTNGAYMWIRVQ